MRRATPWVPVVALVPALLLAGCSDADSGTSTADDQERADEAIATAEQALRDDGFRASSDEGDGDDLGFESEECQEFDQAFPGADGEPPGQTARAQSAMMERELGSGTGALEMVWAFARFVEEPADLDPTLQLVNDERFGTCLQERFRIGVEAAAAEDQARVTLGANEIQQLGSDGLGDTGGGVQMTGEITAAAGPRAPFSAAVQVVRVDRALVGVLTFAVGSGEPAADRAALLRALVERVSEEST